MEASETASVENGKVLVKQLGNNEVLKIDTESINLKLSALRNLILLFENVPNIENFLANYWTDILKLNLNLFVRSGDIIKCHMRLMKALLERLSNMNSKTELTRTIF